MEQNDNLSFENIINSNGFDDRLSKSLEVFDENTDEFYQNFDVMMTDLMERGQFRNIISLDKFRDSLELVVNEIMQQNYDLDAKVTEISGVAMADTVRREKYICQKLGTQYQHEEVIDDMRDVLEDIIYAMDERGMDIPRGFSNEYSLLVQAELQALITELVIKYYHDKQ